MYIYIEREMYTSVCQCNYVYIYIYMCIHVCVYVFGVHFSDGSESYPICRKLRVSSSSQTYIYIYIYVCVCVRDVVFILATRHLRD